MPPWGPLQTDVVPYRAPFFVSEVLFQLREQCGDLLQRRGGLHIYTTLDLALQEKAERLLKEDGQSPVRGTPDEAGGHASSSGVCRSTSVGTGARADIANGFR